LRQDHLREERVQLQQQINSTAGLATLEVAQPLGWQAAAIGEYERSLPTRHADLRMDLAAHILSRTGQQISSGGIYTDGRLAILVQRPPVRQRVPEI